MMTTENREFALAIKYGSHNAKYDELIEKAKNYTLRPKVQSPKVQNQWGTDG